MSGDFSQGQRLWVILGEINQNVDFTYRGAGRTFWEKPVLHHSCLAFFCSSPLFRLAVQLECPPLIQNFFSFIWLQTELAWSVFYVWIDLIIGNTYIIFFYQFEENIFSLSDLSHGKVEMIVTCNLSKQEQLNQMPWTRCRKLYQFQIWKKKKWGFIKGFVIRKKSAEIDESWKTKKR